MVVEELWGMHTHPVPHRKATGWSSQRSHGRKIRQFYFLQVVLALELIPMPPNEHSSSEDPCSGLNLQQPERAEGRREIISHRPSACFSGLPCRRTHCGIAPDYASKYCRRNRTLQAHHPSGLHHNCSDPEPEGHHHPRRAWQGRRWRLQC